MVLRDSDSNDAVGAFNKLRRDVDNLISNYYRFPQHKPGMDCGQEVRVRSFTYYDCALRYKGGIVHFRFIFVVPSLESFLRDYGYVNDDSSLHNAIEKALSDPRNNDVVNIFKNAFGSC
ncbi:hypothetical protein [Vulcanisaeta distributa]|uniref:hypothetical protein n=1 Tax=Vulcanisaeta distributa TaxID=164451 RepID=UPI001FB435BA|nr:hypothetical protein [Vulcanisaeta distributa]